MNAYELYTLWCYVHHKHTKAKHVEWQHLSKRTQKVWKEYAIQINASLDNHAGAANLPLPNWLASI
jgi:hypothetical protein